MDATRWQRLETLFHAALESDPDERSALLRDATADDPTLYDELHAMLAAHADAGRLALETQLLRDDSPAPAARDPVGSLAGPYRLRERIGAGGMGVVHRAERSDGEYDQTVAIKLVRSGLVTEDLVNRFRTERQILARLEHPAIARLMDGGITEAGVPYLVMEYVRGEPITEHCDARQLPVEERLRLFRIVCDAVNHAHRNLIVHRDLKPSNILVTPEGSVKLLDFGIARLVGPDDGDGIASTVFQALTPEYASPEQVLGRAITTATDVYALGLLLYELLCGRSAQRGGGSSLLAMQRAVCEEEPPSPSSAALDGPDELRLQRAEERGLRGAERLSRRLRGDLDTIVAMALRKEPSRRYASVEQLANDVDRHLAALPVHARGDTLTYRSARFLRRNRVAVAAAAIIALSIVTGLALALTGMRRAQRAEAAALEQAATATSALTFLVDLFRASDPADARGDTLTARELLDRGAVRIREQLSDQPQVRARLLSTMAQAYESLGLFDPAIELVEEELGIRAASGGATLEAGVALGNLSDLYGRKGDYVRARELAREAVAIQTRAAEPYSIELMNALDVLGSANGRLGNLDEAREALEEALAIGERTLGPDAAGITSMLNNLAIVHWQQGDPAAATPLFTRAISILEREYGADHPAVANTMNNLALAYGRAGDTARAIEVHRRVLALRERVLGPEHPNVGESLNNVGVLLLDRDFPAARAALERALDIRQRALPPDHPHVASTLSNLGFAHLGLGNPQTARPLLERALSALDRAGERDRVMATYPMLGLARVEEMNGAYDVAEAWYRKVIQIRESELGPDHPELRPAVRGLTELLRERGNHAAADSLDARFASDHRQ